MSCTGSTILPWTRPSVLPTSWVHVSMLLAPFDFSQIRIAGREERGTKSCASTFTISSIRPVGASQRRCAPRGKCSGACAELAAKSRARKTITDYRPDLPTSCEFRVGVYAHPKTDLVRGCNPGRSFAVMNRRRNTFLQDRRHRLNELTRPLLRAG